MANSNKHMRKVISLKSQYLKEAGVPISATGNLWEAMEMDVLVKTVECGET